ncbi:HAMP domain-containing sensor histidine kinase [Sphingomonas sp.]|uniref:sensor histidine kinase n=1 Tax=Sphingomonas sp. TaxID=28214 RepID=UPI001EC42FF6|nr:HAMP domain-containing sensor histidine kinase [Sphingomonas sp.]MBX3594692.1 HAMP domain-containing histidine kinase [Sphingomonas sp.]
MLRWLPLRTTLVIGALAAVALAGLTLGLLQMVAGNARDLALVRSQADAAVLSSKIASLPPGYSVEEREAEVLTMIAARALQATDGGRCDSGERTRALFLYRMADGTTRGTPRLVWPGGSGEVRFSVPAGVACQHARATAVGVIEDLGGGRSFLSARIYSPDPRLVTRAYLLAGGVAIAFLALASLLAWALMRGWRTRLDRFNALLDRADRSGFSERAEEDDDQPEFRSLARHLNALLARSEDMIGGMRRLHRHVAHDLRGPVMVARRHLEALGAKAPGEPLIGETDAKLVTVDKRCRMLLGIIDAEVSRGAGTDIVDPAARVRQLIDDMFVYLGDDKDLDFDLDAQQGQVRVPGDLFDRMIENILGNAVKFATPETMVRCRVERDGDEMRITVENDGPGIEPSKIDRIFEPGYSSGGADSHGLGLAFVKTVSLRAGGNVQASNIAHGFRIAISLPAVKEEARA